MVNKIYCRSVTHFDRFDHIAISELPWRPAPINVWSSRWWAYPHMTLFIAWIFLYTMPKYALYNFLLYNNILHNMLIMDSMNTEKFILIHANFIYLTQPFYQSYSTTSMKLFQLTFSITVYFLYFSSYAYGICFTLSRNNFRHEHTYRTVFLRTYSGQIQNISENAVYF